MNVQTLPTATFSQPRILLHLEGAALLLVSVSLYAHLSGDGLAFVLLLFVPDFSALGYLINTRVGATGYNIGHFLGLPLLLALVALATGWQAGVLLALIWAAHIGLDRMFGYGFKYATAFKDTHLNRV